MKFYLSLNDVVAKFLNDSERIVSKVSLHDLAPESVDLADVVKEDMIPAFSLMGPQYNLY